MIHSDTQLQLIVAARHFPAFFFFFPDPDSDVVFCLFATKPLHLGKGSRGRKGISSDQLVFGVFYTIQKRHPFLQYLWKGHPRHIIPVSMTIRSMKCGFLPGCSAHLDVEYGLNTAKLPLHMRGAISFVGVNVFVGIGIFRSQDLYVRQVQGIFHFLFLLLLMEKIRHLLR